jgi:hypothetical protein
MRLGHVGLKVLAGLFAIATVFTGWYNDLLSDMDVMISIGVLLLLMPPVLLFGEGT